MYNLSLEEEPFQYHLCFPQLENKPLCFTGEQQLQPIIKIISDNDIYQECYNDGFHYFSDMPMSEEIDEQLMGVVQNLNKINQVLNDKETTKCKKSKKNSNAIKKMGRIILNNLDKYKISGRPNPGVKNMLNQLSERSLNKKSKTMVDGFNTYHLQALFDIQEKEISDFNLKKTRSIFTECIRKEVLNSFQIKGDGKLLYLNSLKCSSLRFMNKRLANRLQTSENQQ